MLVSVLIMVFALNENRLLKETNVQDDDETTEESTGKLKKDVFRSLLFILLSYILFNPVRNMLKKRQEMITATREETAEANKEAKALKEEYDALEK